MKTAPTRTSTASPASTGPRSLAHEIVAYAADFELIRIGMLAGCMRTNPSEALEQLWMRVYDAVPAAGKEMSDLIVAHRRAVSAFRFHGRTTRPGACGLLDDCRKAHFAALAQLCRRLESAGYRKR